MTGPLITPTALHRRALTELAAAGDDGITGLRLRRSELRRVEAAGWVTVHPWKVVITAAGCDALAAPPVPESPGEAHAQLIRWANGGPLPTVVVEGVVYDDCEVNGWMATAEIEMRFVATPLGCAAIGEPLNLPRYAGLCPTAAAAASDLTCGRVVLVPCGGAKLDARAPAGRMYVGSYHQATRRAASAVGGRLIILSAKYGLLDPGQVIDPYDLRMGQPGCVSVATVAAQAHRLGVADPAEVIVLAGAAYAEVASSVWPHARRPLDGTTGIGPQLQRLAAITRTGTLPHINKEELMTAPAVPRRSRADRSIHTLVTTPWPHHRSLVKVTCSCGRWQFALPATRNMAATLFEQHTDKLATKARKSTTAPPAAISSRTTAPPRTAKKSTSSASAARRTRQASAADITRVESLFAALFSGPTADTAAQRDDPVPPADGLVYPAALDRLGKGTRFRVGGSRILTYDSMQIASPHAPTMFRITTGSGSTIDVDARDRTIEVLAAEDVQYEERLTRLLHLGPQRTVLGTVEAAKVATGVYAAVTGRLPDSPADATLVGYVVDAYRVVQNYQGWTTTACMAITVAEHPHHLDGVAIEVPFDRDIDVLDPDVPVAADVRHAGEPAPWRRPTVQGALAAAGLQLGAEDGPGTIAWRMPWQTRGSATAADLERHLFSSCGGPVGNTLPRLKQKHLDKAVADGVWPGTVCSGPTPLRLVREGAYGTLTGRLDGVDTTVTGEFDRYWTHSHGRRRHATAFATIRTHNEHGDLRVVNIEVPAAGVDFTVHDRPGPPQNPVVGAVLPLHEVPLGTYGTVKGMGPDGSRRTETGYLTKLPRIYTGGEGGKSNPKYKGVELLSIFIHSPNLSVSMYCPLNATFTVQALPTDFPLRTDTVLANLGCRMPARDLRTGDVVAPGYLGQSQKNRGGKQTTVLADPEQIDDDRVRIAVSSGGTPGTVMVDGWQWVTVDVPVAYQPATSSGSAPQRTLVQPARHPSGPRSAAAKPGRIAVGRRNDKELAERHTDGEPLVRQERQSSRAWSWVCPVPTCMVMRNTFITARLAKLGWLEHCTQQTGKNHPVNFHGAWPDDIHADDTLPADAMEVKYGKVKVAVIYKVGNQWAFECAFGHGSVPHAETVGSQWDTRSYAVAHGKRLHQVPDPEIPTDEDLLPKNPANDMDPKGLYRRIRDEADAILNQATNATDADVLAWAAGVTVMTHSVDVLRYTERGRRANDMVSDYRGGTLNRGRFYDADRSKGFRVTVSAGRDGDGFLEREEIFKVTWARVKKLLDRVLADDETHLARINQAGWRRARALRQTPDDTDQRRVAEQTCHEVVAMLWDAARPDPSKKTRTPKRTISGPPRRRDRPTAPPPAPLDLGAFLLEAQAALR